MLGLVSLSSSVWRQVLLKGFSSFTKFLEQTFFKSKQMKIQKSVEWVNKSQNKKMDIKVQQMWKMTNTKRLEICKKITKSTKDL